MVDFIKRDKNDIYSKPILGFLFKNQKFLMTLKIAVTALFFYAIYFGYTHTGKDNLFTWAVFWGVFWALFMVVTLPTLGRVFCGICPHGFMGKYITRFGLKKTMPKWMQNRYIGIFILVIGWWGIYYMFPNLFRTPLGTALMFSVMTLIAVVFYFLYKDMSYCKYICPIGVLTRVYSKLSFTWLGTYKSACNECKTFECATACPHNLKPFTFDKRNSMTDCTLCMDCSSACEAVSFKFKKPAFSLDSKFQVLKAEVWALMLIFASISVTMAFHHGIGRSAAANDMIWSKTAEYLKQYINFGSIDTVGLFAFIYAILFTVVTAIAGMFIASKILKKDFSKIFYDLGYAYAPLFILGSIGHSLETFFTRGYEKIVEGFAQGFGFSIDVAPLATRADGWLHMFGLLKWIGVIWAISLLYKRMKLLDVKRVRKVFAFPFAASLVIFYIGVNIYTGYIFKTYGAASSGHNHSSHSSHGGKMFQSVALDKATLLKSGKDKNSCSVCGMNLPKFYKTNHSATTNNKPEQYCSIHCLAEVKEIDKTSVNNIKVVDVKSLKFIDANSAFYVVGSKKKATMSRVSKYAFADKADAYKFSKQFGGEVVDFKEAIKVAMRDFSNQTNKTTKEPSVTDSIYISDENPMANKNTLKHGGHMHGGGGPNWVPTKKVWPVFLDESSKVNCLNHISAKLYILDANLNTTELQQSKDRGCKSVSFKIKDNGYYNLYYLDKEIKDETLYFKNAKYEYLRFNHAKVVYDKQKMSAHTIKEATFDILRLRDKNDEDEEFFHSLNSGDEIKLKVLLNSKPIEGASVTLTKKGGWSKTLQTDKDGIVSFVLIKDYFPKWNEFNKRYKNRFLLSATYTQDIEGEYLYEKYSKVKYLATYPSFYYPSEDNYKSYAYGLLFTTFTLIISGLIIYWYRKRREKPFKEVKFNEKD